jgi:lipoyl(octanoyl) transferase
MDDAHGRIIKAMTPLTKTAPLEFVDLSRIAYGPAFQLQQELHEQVLNGQRPPTILLLEHDPVITLSKRDSARDHLLAAPALLQRLGIEVADTDRGGDVTYHGPGQLVAYPILPLEGLGLNVRQYVRTLEQVIIDTLAAFGIAAHRDVCAVGVWVGELEPSPLGRGQGEGVLGDPVSNSAAHPSNAPGGVACPNPSPLPEGEGAEPSRKIAAIGVRVKRWVSMHGLALNVTTNLDHFKLIVPCGLAGRPVTSMEQELGDRCPTMDQVKTAMIEQFKRQLYT